ncbi:MAG: type II toxin-antitoxin system RelE/ParE family toxin [Deinococcales bacterium]
MIKSFADKETELLFAGRFIRRLPIDIQRRAKMKLNILDAATNLETLRVPPGNKLEKLMGNRKTQHSIRINEQWRICFRWEEGNAFEVEITDYH